MSRRIRFGAAFGTICLVAAIAAPAVLAAGNAHVTPANTIIKNTLKPGTTTSFSGTLGSGATAVNVISKCTASTVKFKTPAHGLGPVKATTPTFSGCTDNLHGTDTIKENSNNGNWTVKFVNTAKAELRIPKAGGTVVSSLAPTCVITIAPNGPVTIAAAYKGRTTTFKNVSLPVSTSATCPGGATTSKATFSARYVSTPKIKVVS